MKNFLLPLFAATILSAGSAAAQTTPTMSSDGGAMQGRGRMQGNPEEMAKRQSQRMTQELGLNADQSTRVQQILMARSQEMQSMRGQGAGDRDKMREQMQANRSKYDAQLKEVLTADQYTKYTSMEGNRMNRGGGRGPGMGGPGMGASNTGIEKMKAKSEDGDKIKMKEDKLKMKSDKAKAKADKKVKVKAD